MSGAHRILVAALVALSVLYATWFASHGPARDPAAAWVPVPARASRRSSSRSSCAVTATSARRSRAICASRSMFRPPVSATTS